MVESIASMREAIRALPLGLRSLVRPDVATGCLIWRAGADRQGYGRTWGLGGEVLAHRSVWAATYGPIARRVRIRHRCGNTLCVRVEHLEAVAQVAPGESGPRRKALCKRGHSLLDPENVWVGSSGKRVCRACNRLRRREFDRKRRHETVEAG